MRNIKRLALGLLNSLLGKLGLELASKNKGMKGGFALGYIGAKETINAAKERNLTVCDYLEMIWNKQGDTQRVIDKMKEMGIFDRNITRVCEIGTGSGRYLEKVVGICNPARYESYETAEDWAEWLQEQYGIISQPADGKSLASTHTSSMDLVHAHGVFVYLPFLTTYRYFQEIVRVIDDNGYVVFDIISEECLDADTVKAWIESEHNYPCFLSKQHVIEFFTSKGFSFLGDFLNRYGPGKSQYLIFKKQLSVSQ